MKHREDGAPKAPAEDLNSVVQENIRKVLAGRTPEAYCSEPNRALVYVSGNKKGKPVSSRALRYAISQEQSPRLDMIAAIAHKEGIPAYQFLISHAATGEARRWQDFRPGDPTHYEG